MEKPSEVAEVGPGWALRSPTDPTWNGNCGPGHTLLDILLATNRAFPVNAAGIRLKLVGITTAPVWIDYRYR